MDVDLVAPCDVVSFENAVRETEPLSLLTALGSRSVAACNGRSRRAQDHPSFGARIAKTVLTGRMDGTLPSTDERVDDLLKMSGGLLDFPPFEPNSPQRRAETLLRWGYDQYVYQGDDLWDVFARYDLLMRCRETFPDLATDPKKWIDLDNEVGSIYGCAYADLLPIAFAFFVSCSMHEARVDASTLFAPVADRAKAEAILHKLLSVIARRPEEIRDAYIANPERYQNERFRKTEYNILRDYPVVRPLDDPNKILVPSIHYLGYRLTLGIMYEALERFRAREERENPKNSEPNNNRMSQFWGALQHQYILMQLRQATSARKLRNEFEYYVGKNRVDSPDLMLEEPQGLILIESKRQHPRLELRTTGDLRELVEQFRRGIAYGQWQNAKSVLNLRKGHLRIGVAQPTDEVLSVVVVPEAIPWLGLPAVRSAFDEAIRGLCVSEEQIACACTTPCVVLGVDEVEMVVPYVRQFGLWSILSEYHSYLRDAPLAQGGQQIKAHRFGTWFSSEWLARLPKTKRNRRNELLRSKALQMFDETKAWLAGGATETA
jgi:hypothetical protein